MTRTFTTDADIRDMVIETLEAGEGAQDFDVEAIVADIVASAEFDGREYDLTDVDVWEVIGRHDVSAQRTDAGHNRLGGAEIAHNHLSALEAQVADARSLRDELIRAAIADGVTMYAIAKRLGITEQGVRRIRDRG